ncbi:rod shape-determining protein MreD [Nocardioides bruguierae]|uniref:Rod shape-determining protein MreD n=1 Tax=Nocardioides bruguierae TaxID=2945102 RepID=A0A9X2D5N8_9ACTN|nr:rod shape-determining protein MreD [Nocardioides bruguierae]MCM0619781.1 rod shape-determining protein MreD [Nocardioides bruguierae]
MSALRAVATGLAVLVALLLQVTVAPHVAWHGVVPDLVLLVVVAVALARGPNPAMVVGFAAGLLVDLAPPADHVAGRWALALVLVGYLAGRLRPDVRPTALSSLATVAGCAFVGASVVALTGLVLSDPAGVATGDLMLGVLVSVAWDVALTPLVLPPLLALLRRLETPERGTA